MHFNEFVGKNNFDIIHFSFTLIKEIDQKLKGKTFFYKNQVISYVNERVDRFIRTLAVKCSLKLIYKAEIHQLVNQKLNKLFKKYSLLGCV